MKAFSRTLAVLFIVSIIISAGKAHASSWTLKRTQDVGSGTNTSFAISADFNGDGITDIATCNRLVPGKVSISLGKGDGKFIKKAAFNTGKRPVSMAAGDFDGDGKMDLAVVNWGDNAIGTTPPVDPGNVTVYIGKGDGTFKTNLEDPDSEKAYTVGTNPVYVVSADFNEDGYTDLVAANWGSDSVSVLLNNSSTPGMFDISAPVAVGTHPRSIVAGNIDQKDTDLSPKHLDLVVANWFDDTLSLLHGNGDGTFAFTAATDTVTAGKNPVSVALADINGDGWLDMVAANFDSDNVSLLFSDGAGGFKPVEFLATQIGPSFVTVKDFDGDGMMDIITCNGTASNVSLFWGNGDGTFQMRRDFTSGSYPAAAILSDFNGDGAWDLAVANYLAGTFSAFTAKNKLEGDWMFLTAPIASTSFPPTAVFATDLNRDEFTDVVATAKNDNSAFVLLNDGKGALSVKSVLATGNAPESAAAADFTGDGIKDIAVADSLDNNIIIFKGKGDGSYDPGTPLAAGTTPVSVINADFDKDGKTDLAVCNSGDNDIQIFHGDGTGAFTTGVSDLYAVGTTPVKVVTGDFNADGKPDLAVANNGSDNVSILIGNGTGSFQAAVNYAAGTGPVSLAAADFNADKKADLAVANQGSNNVSILLNNGTGTFRAGTGINIGTAPSSIAAADLNLDVKPDLAVTSGDTVFTYFGKGSGLFDTASPTVSINGAVSAVISEFNKDGKADLAVASSTGPGIYVINGMDKLHITTTVDGSGSISPATGDYEAGKNIQLKATPDPGSYFKGWGGALTGSENPRLLLISSTSKNKTYTARFGTGPYIAGLSADQGVLKDSITITGSNFGTSKGMVYIGVNTAIVTSWADTSITFTVPTNIPCNRYKLHIVAGGKTSNPVDFYILKAFITGSDAPSVTAPLDFTVTGTSFGPDKVTVSLYPLDKISGTNCTVRSFSNTSVTFTVPKLTAGKYIIKVKNAHGYSNGWPLTVN